MYRKPSKTPSASQFLMMAISVENIRLRMRRPYTAERAMERIEALRRSFPAAMLTADVIVGFPGETEEDFCELCQFVKDAKFERFGAFTYSREEDTPAYDFEDQIDEQIKQDRADIIMREQLEINTANNEKMLNKTITVLCEDYDPVARVHFGRSAADAPEIDGKVYFRAEKRIAPGSFVKVKVREVLDYDLMGRAITQN